MILAPVFLMGLGLAAFKIVSVPFNDNGGDMLLFIQHAIDVFRDGHDPYKANFSTIDVNPFFYLPLQWLLFAPFRIAGLDLRIMNLLCVAAVIAFAEWRARAGYGSGIRLAVYPFILSPISFQMIVSGQVWPYWALLIAASTFLCEGRDILAALGFGFAIGVRQTALIPAAVAVAGLWNNGRGYVLRLIFIAGVLAVGLTAPFLRTLADWKQVLVFGPAQALIEAHREGNPKYQVALSGLLDFAGVARLDVPLQLILLGLAVGLSLIYSRRSVGTALTISGLSYLMVISANSYVHDYYYMAGLFIAAVGILCPLAKEQGP